MLCMQNLLGTDIRHALTAALAGDTFQTKIDEIFKDLPNVVCIEGDILDVGYDIEGTDHDARLHRVLQICRKDIIKRNKDKCHFRCTSTPLCIYINWNAQVTTKGELHLPSLVFAYNVTLHGTTRYQTYELMFGHNAPTICETLLRLANYNDNFSQSKCAWFNQQHELILAANRWALKRIKHSAERSVLPGRRKSSQYSTR